MAFSILSVLVAAVVALPGGPPVGMDYLAYDPTTNRVWVPAGNTGNVDVLDVATGKLTAIPGLTTAPSRRPDRPRMGPSSAVVGDGVVWIGNRGDGKVHAFDARTLAARGVVSLPSMPDGIAYVKATHELWVTTPRDQTISIANVANAAAPGPVATIKLDGDPEGFAVDGARGAFYTNLEDKDRTLTLDIKTRKVIASWPSGCGSEGPRGLALDAERRWLFVACTDGATVWDLAPVGGQVGKVLGRIKTGGGVDNLDYDPRRRLLFVASGKDGNMVVAHVDDHGALQKVAVAVTAKGARNPVLDAKGTAYVEDAPNGRLIVVDVAARVGSGAGGSPP
jgi:DNA-binding beta-propeller fold protein YncE